MLLLGDAAGEVVVEEGERLPEGVTGTAAPHFWQKDTPAYYPAWIPRVEIPSERGRPVRYVLVNDQETLLYLVNQDALTFHVWLSRVHNLDRPDFVLFDLDPPSEATFTDVMVVAKQLHERLQAEAARSEEAWRAQMNAAHAEGQAHAAEAKAKALREAEKRIAKADQELAAKSEAANKALMQARNSALAEIESVAVEAAQEIVAKLTGAKVTAKAAQAAVSGAMKRP